MEWLARAGYQTIGFDDLVSARDRATQLPRRPLIITFDDGFRDAAELAAPVMLACGFTATFYLVAALVGRDSEWLRAERGVSLPLFDWRTARELEGAGFSCGAHSLTHPHLAALSEPECRRELAASRSELEDHLGHRVLDFAYPFGSYDERVRQWTADAGYRTACSVRIGISSADDDLLALHRVPVSGNDSIFDFICRMRAGYSPLEHARRGAARARQWLRARSGA